jgi:hypothetical protein
LVVFIGHNKYVITSTNVQQCFKMYFAMEEQLTERGDIKHTV